MRLSPFRCNRMTIVKEAFHVVVGHRNNMCEFTAYFLASLFVVKEETKITKGRLTLKFLSQNIQHAFSQYKTYLQAGD